MSVGHERLDVHQAAIEYAMPSARNGRMNAGSVASLTGLVASLLVASIGASDAAAGAYPETQSDGCASLTIPSGR